MDPLSPASLVVLGLLAVLKAPVTIEREGMLWSDDKRRPEWVKDSLTGACKVCTRPDCTRCSAVASPANPPPTIVTRNLASAACIASGRASGDHVYYIRLALSLEQLAESGGTGSEIEVSAT